MRPIQNAVIPVRSGKRRFVPEPLQLLLRAACQRRRRRARWSTPFPRKKTVLELRPSCEHCNAALPPHSTAARICSYECTFCASCVDTLLDNVCPNCGGGFAPRPIRPARDWKDGNWLGQNPASNVVRYRPVDMAAHRAFAAVLRELAPELR